MKAKGLSSSIKLRLFLPVWLREQWDKQGFQSKICSHQNIGALRKKLLQPQDQGVLHDQGIHFLLAQRH